MNLWHSLLDNEPADPARRECDYKLLELTICVCAMANLWAWADPISRNPVIAMPLGLARYVDVSFMLSAPAAYANAGLASALLLLGLARKLRPAYLLALVLFHLQYVARFSLGKSGHGANVVGFGLLALGLAELAFQDRASQRRAGRGLLLLLLGLSYALAAACKLIATGVRWIDGENLWLWIAEKSVDNVSSFGADRLNVFQRLILEQRALATFVLSVGLLSELAGLLIWFPRPRLHVLLALLAMHLGIMLAMDISFFSNMAILGCLALSPLRQQLLVLGSSKLGRRRWQAPGSMKG